MATPASAKEEDALEEFKEVAGKTALAAALAGAVTTGAAAITPDQVALPDVAPMVQTLDVGTGNTLPDSAADANQNAEANKSSVWKKIFQILKYALIVLFVAASFMFGLLRGCASCAGPLAVPGQSEQESSSLETPAETS